MNRLPKHLAKQREDLAKKAHQRFQKLEEAVNKSKGETVKSDKVVRLKVKKTKTKKAKKADPQELLVFAKTKAAWDLLTEVLVLGFHEDLFEAHKRLQQWLESEDE